MSNSQILKISILDKHKRTQRENDLSNMDTQQHRYPYRRNEIQFQNWLIKKKLQRSIVFFNRKSIFYEQQINDVRKEQNQQK